MRFPSASGQGAQGQRIPFHVDNGHHVGGLTHFHVLNDPDVYRQMHAWLESDRVGTGLPLRLDAGDGPVTDVPLG